LGAQGGERRREIKRYLQAKNTNIIVCFHLIHYKAHFCGHIHRERVNHVLGSKDVLKTTSMHQPKVGAGTSILRVAYIGSYLLFSIPSLQRCNTCKGTSILKGTAVVLFKGTTIVTLGRTNVELIAL
jgi:hypothetical protein